MKKIVCVTLLLLCGVIAFAEIKIPFFGGNSFQAGTETTFAVDANDGSTGLEAAWYAGLWFEYVPYADRNITPQRDTLSVSLKLSNSAIYAWRGYDFLNAPPDTSLKKEVQNGYVGMPNDVTSDQAMSIWFDTFVAQLEYNQFWIRLAGLDPEVTFSQASIRSVFDPIIKNRTAIDKNRMYLPFFHSAAHYRPWPNYGIVPVIGYDLVHLNRREVIIAGNLSAGMKNEILDAMLKVASWKTAEENVDNSWVFGGDVTMRPDLFQTITVSLFSALNYGTTQYIKQDGTVLNDPIADKNALVENPFAAGLGYEYRINLFGRQVMKPYVGADFIYETKNNEYKWEVGGGLQWFFRGTGAQFKRNTSIGGERIGDVEIPAAFILGMNINHDKIVNAVISLNEAPQSSPIPGLGGFMNIELMNIGAQDYTALDGKTYGDFLWAGAVQVEYLVHEKIMPYVFVRYMPSLMPLGFDMKTDDPIFDKDHLTLTSKLGCRFMPLQFFSVDFWYERIDYREKKTWTRDDGRLSVCFAIIL
jgi:hypothetical protein